VLRRAFESALRALIRIVDHAARPAAARAPCRLKSINAVRAKLNQAILYIERNPETVKSITSFPYIVRSL
jgi:hypothetical protein